MAKAMSTSSINASPETKALRNVGRIKTLRRWLEQAETYKGTDRQPKAAKVKSVRDELTRREAELAELRAALDEV